MKQNKLPTASQWDVAETPIVSEKRTHQLKFDPYQEPTQVVSIRSRSPERDNDRKGTRQNRPVTSGEGLHDGVSKPCYVAITREI